MLRKGIILTVLILVLLPGAVRAASAVPEEEFTWDGLPDVAFITDLVAHGQTYALSCESRSASDLAGYWGVSAPEVQFFNSLPKSDNPEKGFVGSVHGTWGGTPPNAYGVHAKPIAALLREYGLDATARRGMTIADLKFEIANGRPVIVWVVGHVWQGTSQEYYANDGNTVLVAGYEHTMIAYGYDLAGIYLVDAGNAARKGYSYQVFEDSWSVLGNMAVTATGTKATNVNSQTFTSADYYTVKKGDYLSQLARQWGMDWQELAQINSIAWPYTIFPGQILVTVLDPDTPEPTDGPSPTVSPVPTATPEPIETPEPTLTPTSKPTSNKVNGEIGDVPPPSEYTVKKGEHLMQIARDLGVNWQAVADMNELYPPYRLYPGQVLLLPGPGESPADDGPALTGSGETYTVQEGEYLYKIASRMGISWRAAGRPERDRITVCGLSGPGAGIAVNSKQ